MNHYATKEEQNTEMNMLVDVLATSHECPNVPHKRRTKHRDEYVDVLATSHECPTVPCPIPGLLGRLERGATRSPDLPVLTYLVLYTPRLVRISIHDPRGSACSKY